MTQIGTTVDVNGESQLAIDDTSQGPWFTPPPPQGDVASSDKRRRFLYVVLLSLFSDSTTHQSLYSRCFAVSPTFLVHRACTCDVEATPQVTSACSRLCLSD